MTDATTTPRTRRRDLGPAPTSQDPIDIALATESAGGEASADSPARVLLEKQARLIDADLKHRGLQIASERVGYALKLLVGVAGLAVAVTLAAMAWEASQANGLVIEPLAIPPDLAQSGLSGQVVANKILDRMAAIQSETDSVRKASTFSRAWEGGIKVEIPQTGVTLAELDRELRSRLGHEHHLSGEVVRTADGYTLTVRSGLDPGRTVRGPDIDALIAPAAEASFELTQPYRFAVWLRGQGRLAEATEIYRRLSQVGPPGERAFAHLGLATDLRERVGMRPALVELEIAEGLTPKYLLAPLNIGYIEQSLGHPERAVAALRRTLANATPDAEVREDRLKPLAGSAQASLLLEQGDFATAAPLWAATIEKGPQGANRSLSSRLIWARLALHEVSAAEAASRQPDPSAGKETGERAMDMVITRVGLANAREQWAAAIAAASAAAPILAWRPGTRDEKLCHLDPEVAWAMANSGDAPGGAALIGATPLDCYDAVIMRGRIATRLGDVSAADHWFAQADRMAPSIGRAPAWWAAALQARGDNRRALETARLAHQRAPHLAEPLEVSGEALVGLGDPKAAEQQFASAAEYAPRWGRLHLMWGKALAKLGKTDEAREKWRAAAGMDLTKAERAALSALP